MLLLNGQTFSSRTGKTSGLPKFELMLNNQGLAMARPEPVNPLIEEVILGKCACTEDFNPNYSGKIKGKTKWTGY
jgi:hypothetical protein